jgi:acetylglutamate kinase
VHVLILDAYHLGDPLFLSQLARDLKVRGGGILLVHATGEAGERAIESGGGMPRAVAGVWEIAGDREAAAVERAGRELNRQIVHELNEAGVPAVRVLGADRGLLRATEDGLETGRTAWLADLLRQGVVPVVGTLVEHGAGPLREADAGIAAAALAAALGVPDVHVIGRADGPAEGVPVSDLVASGGTDVELIRRILAVPRGVRMVAPAGLRAPGALGGTRILS